ncbi:beta-lactamase superfamily protein [Naviculisporaceae sp. PSN 640]
MALTVKHLNGDASFMLTFEALLPDQPPFRILIDPWITGKSKIFHSKISVTTHKERACITSLRELPEPDLVIISQNKSDHCNEDTLRQLPAKNTKTIILAEPASARTIRSWKHFEKGKVQAIPRWGDPRLIGRQAVVRMKVPSFPPGQIEPGEVTVAFIPQRKDITGLHAAIGITYRPPQAMMQPPRRCYNSLAPSHVPRSYKSYTNLRPPPSVSPPNTTCSATNNACPPIPASPTSSTTLRSVRSASSLATTMRDSCYSTASFSLLDRPLSVIFSPHGINYASLHSYTTSHLVAEAALPLTALLHCFDSVSNPWWLGGNILLGAPAGMEIASKLGARAWISTHDGEKVVKGIATGFLRTRKWREEDVLGAMSSAELSWRRENKRLNERRLEDLSSSTLALPSSPTTTLASTVTTEKVRIGTEVVRLRSGEEATTQTEIHIIPTQNRIPPPPARQPPPPPPLTAPPPPPPPPPIITTLPTIAAAIPKKPTTTTTTSSPTKITFPEIPPSFTERRWNQDQTSSSRSRNSTRGGGSNKTQSGSDFASFEEIMMMRGS